jgi:hypothetical protein
MDSNCEASSGITVLVWSPQASGLGTVVEVAGRGRSVVVVANLVVVLVAAAVVDETPAREVEVCVPSVAPPPQARQATRSRARNHFGTARFLLIWAIPGIENSTVGP